MVNSTYKIGNGNYDMLEIRGGDKIPYIKGREIRADGIYYLDYRFYTGYKRSIKEDNTLDDRVLPRIAKGRNLQVNAVREAIEWCLSNKKLMISVWEKDAKEAGLKV